MKIERIWNGFLIALNILWKLGMVSIGVAAVFFSIFLVKEWRLGQMRDGEKLSAYLTEYTEDGYKKLYNEREKKFTLERLDWVSHGVGEDGIGVYSKNLRRGFYDYKTGKPLSENIYNKAWNFSEGLGAVETDGMLGFVDKNMNLVIPQKFKIVRASDDWPDAIQFKNGQCVLHLTPDSVGVIDRFGNWVVKPEYEYVSELTLDSCRIVRKNGYAGLIDFKGNQIFEPMYDAIRVTNPNVAVVAKDGLQKQVTYNGALLLKSVYDDVSDFDYPSDKYMLFKVNNKWGVMNKLTTEPIIPALYTDIDLLSGDLFKARLVEDEWVSSSPNSRTVSFVIINSHNQILSK